MHDEYGQPGTPVVTALACSLDGTTVTLNLTPGARLAAIYDTTSPPVEMTTCNYGLAPDMEHIADMHGMTIAATDDTSEARAIERTDHPFFIATLSQPQLSSTPEHPHPILRAFIDAISTTPERR
jgi:CTP synthase (UTP-ammonia lyase)